MRIGGPEAVPVHSPCSVSVSSRPAAVVMAAEQDISANLLREEVKHGDGDLAAPDSLCWLSVLSCLLLACSYVGSLYVWRSDLPR